MSELKLIGKRNRIQDLTGMVFGQLVVFAFFGQTKAKTSLWSCRCECGKVINVQANHLKNGHTGSCGCRFFRHGDYGTKEYRTWLKVKERCLNENCKCYHNYGARGITICERWRDSYEMFLADMGRAPSKKHSIDRINNNGNYEPGNCHWATAIQQGRNTRSNRIIEINGIRRCLSEWASISGISGPTIINRLKRGWSSAKAVFLPYGILTKYKSVEEIRAGEVALASALKKYGITECVDDNQE